MKVLFCTNAFEKVNNGPAKFAHLLLNESVHSDIEVRILTEDISSDENLVYRLNLYIPTSIKLFGQFIRMWRYHRAAMKIRQTFAFDVLVYNNAIIGFFSYIFFKKTVGMINDDNNAANSISSVLNKKARFNKRLLFYYVEFLCSHLAKRIIVNSNYLEKKIHRQYDVKATKFKILYKGIEGRLVTNDRQEASRNKILGRILFVKTDFERGGLFTLIAALEKFDLEVTLSIVGPPLKHHEGLKKTLAKADVSFELFDYLPPELIYQKMKESEIFCVPSNLEAFGVANLEALACGCKVVTTNVGGIPEALGNTGFSWLVPPGDPKALSAALKEALTCSNTNEAFHKLSEHLERFSSTQVVKNFKQIISGVY